MAYTISITLDTPRPQRISRDLAIMTGYAELSSYNSSQGSAEITSITGKFKTTKAVLPGGLTTNGYAVHWNRSTGTFKAFNPAPARSLSTSASLAVGKSTSMSTTSNSSVVVYLSTTSSTFVTNTSAATVGLTAATSALSAAAGTEVANSTSVGTFSFMAIGFI